MVLVKVGFQFTDCPQVEWDYPKIAYLEGYAPPSSFYGWTLDLHHKLEPQSAMLYLGNGHTFDLKKGIPVVQDFLDFSAVDELPVTITSNGYDLVFLGTNAAVYELDITKNSVRITIIFLK